MANESKYRKSLDEQWCMRFQTDHPDGNAYSGVVVSSARDFIVVAEFRDFVFDGYQTIPKHRIADVRDKGFEACANDIIRESGEFGRMSVPEWLSKPKKLVSLVDSLRLNKIWPIVETAPDDDGDTALYIGPITQVSSESFDIYCYDATGQWEKEYTLGFNEVFRIEVESRYSRYFNAYMKRRHPRAF